MDLLDDDARSEVRYKISRFCEVTAKISVSVSESNFDQSGLFCSVSRIIARYRMIDLFWITLYKRRGFAPFVGTMST